MSNPTDVDSEPGSERQDGDRRPPEPDLDFWAVFESAPDIYLLLAPDPPRFTMLAANDARLRATETRYEDVIGRPLFEIFPDNPADPEATGVRNLRSSLEEVLRTGLPRRMGLQKYDIRNAHGVFEERYWEPLNAPVFDDDGRLLYLIHRVEDVTERVRASRRLKRLESVAEATARQLTHETEARESVEAVLAMGQIAEAQSEGQSSGARKAFSITAEGTAHLGARKADLESLFERLAAFASARERTDGSPLRRAMQNLRAVIINRFDRDDVAPDSVHQAAAILDEAAQRIEKL